MNSGDADQDLANDVRAFSAALGADPMLVQGAGGNVSWKSGKALWIKASGTWLADAVCSDIFVPVDLEGLTRALQAGDFEAKPSVLGSSQLRPSIETLLHGLMPHRVVVHVHAIDVLARLVRSDARDLLMSMELPDVVSAFVPYRKPGAELAQEVAHCLSAVPAANVMYLGSHGLVVGGDCVSQVQQRLESVLAACRSQGLAVSARSVDAPALSPDLAQKWSAIDGVQELARSERLLERVKSSWALYPDHVVFLGARAHVFDNEEALRRWSQGHSDELPDVVFIAGVGVYGVPTMAAGKLAQLRCFHDVLVRVPQGASLQTLDEQDVCGLLNWDAERYRMQLAK